MTPAVSNDAICAMSKRLDDEKLWGRREEKGHCSDRCLQEMFQCNSCMGTCFAVLLKSGMNVLVGT